MIKYIIKKLLREQTSVGFILMLTCCLISDTNAECETPPTFSNAYVQWELSNAVGSSLVYSCNDGYQMSGSADHIVLACNQEEEWNGPDIDCTEKISCPLPPSPAFGSYNLTESGLVFQSSVSFHCQSGYTLDGPVNITCSASGEWSKAQGEEYVEPMCKRLCTQENYRYQYHECYERMDRTDNWYSARTSCDNEGGQLATIKDSTRQSFIENILSGDTTNIYWIGGYELDRDWKYPSNGQYATYFNWAPGEPNPSNEGCVYLSNVNGQENSLKWNDEYCSKSIVDTDPKVPIYCICETDGNCSSLSTLYNKYQYTDRCLSFLNDTARNQGNSKTKCSNDLRGQLVEIKSQQLQDFIENVINSNGYETANWWIGLEEGYNRTWSWVDGERIESFFWADKEPSSSNEKCLDILTNKDYKWNDDGCGNANRKYICQHGEPKCGNPGIPFHGNMTTVKESYSVGDTVYFSCNDGYVISNPLLERMTCQNDSTWSGSVPSCQKRNCSERVPIVPNATSTPVSTVYRGISVFKCHDGHYALKGYPVSVCQEDGTWSNPNFTCTEILTTQKYSTAPPTTTYIDTTYHSTKLVPSTENNQRGQTTQTTGTLESSLLPSFQETEVLDQTKTTQPTAAVDLVTTLEYLVTDSGTPDKTTLLQRLTSEMNDTEITTLGRFIQSTQESYPLSTDGDILTTNLFGTVTKLETRSKPSNPSLTANSVSSTQNFRTSVMFSDESLVTDITEDPHHTTTEGADTSKSFVATGISRDSTLTSDSLITTTWSPFIGSTDISPEVETTLLQSNETLPPSVSTSTDDLGQSTTQISYTNDPKTTELTETESVQTTSLPLSDSTRSSSQDNLPTVTFTSLDSSTTSFTRRQGSTPLITNDIRSTTTSPFKTTRDSFTTTHYRSLESTQGTKWTNGKPSTNLISGTPSTMYTDSTTLKTTDATNFSSELLSTDHFTGFTAGESPKDQTASKTTSLKTPLPTTDFSFVKSTTELSRTQRTTKIITAIYSRSSFHSTSLSPTTTRLTEAPSSSASNSHGPTLEPGRSKQPSESYSKEPETTQQPSNKGLIIGLSVTSAVIGIGLCTWLMLVVIFKKYPGLIEKRNKVNPADSESNSVQDTNRENGQDKTRKKESSQEYTTLQMNELPNDAKPYLYKNNEFMDYI